MRLHFFNSAVLANSKFDYWWDVALEFSEDRPFVALEHLINVHRSIVEPYFTYCCIVWDSIDETLAESLQKLQNRAAFKTFS